MLRRRRPVAAGAAVGVVAHTAGKAGAAAAGADQAAQAAQPAAEQQAAPVVISPTADDSTRGADQAEGAARFGVLTQAEFDAQKQKILQTI